MVKQTLIENKIVINNEVYLEEFIFKFISDGIDYQYLFFGLPIHFNSGNIDKDKLLLGLMTNKPRSIIFYNFIKKQSYKWKGHVIKENYSINYRDFGCKLKIDFMLRDRNNFEKIYCCPFMALWFAIQNVNDLHGFETEEIVLYQFQFSYRLQNNLIIDYFYIEPDINKDINYLILKINPKLKGYLKTRLDELGYNEQYVKNLFKALAK